MAGVGRRLRGFAAFWWDFVVGDDWRVAAGIVVALAATAALAAARVPAWWCTPAVVVVVLVLSVRRGYVMPDAEAEPGGDKLASDDGSGVDDRDDRRETGWLLLTYRIPSEPSRLRAGVWRKLKGNGAIYLQNSVAALPDRPSCERLLRGLRAEITELGGTAQLFRAAALTGGGDVLAAYNAARDDEYEELLDKCQDFLAEIAQETAAEHTTYGELEENDEDLTKLRRWLTKINERDVLQAAGAAQAAAAIERCAAALDEFAQKVYGADPDVG